MTPLASSVLLSVSDDGFGGGLDVPVPEALSRNQPAARRHVNRPPFNSPPSFLSLPDVAYGIIASFLPPRDTRDEANDSRLCMSEVSRALLLSYGGTLSCLRVRHVQGGEAARLFALLQRQRKLAGVIVASKHISVFCHAIVEGCCRTVEKLELILPDSHTYLTNDCTDLLAKTIAMDGLLPALRTLIVRDHSTQVERACWAKLA